MTPREQRTCPVGDPAEPPAAEKDGVGSGDEDELARVLEAYLGNVEAGRAVDMAQLLTRHPAIADRLRVCLGSLRLVDRADHSLSAAGYPPDRDEPERRLGDFRIIRKVGRGDVGIVCDAEPLSLRSPVRRRRSSRSTARSRGAPAHQAAPPRE